MALRNEDTTPPSAYAKQVDLDSTNTQLATMQNQLEDNSMQVITTSNAVTSLSGAIDGVGQVTLIEGNTVVNNGVISNLQVNSIKTKSADNTKESTITLPSQIQDLKAIGSVKDSYNPSSGEWVKNIGMVVFDGSEDEIWDDNGTASTNNVTFYTGLIHKNSGGIVNDKSFSFYQYPNYEEECVFAIDDSVMFLNIAKSKLSTVNVSGFRSWLASNPITVLYQLTTPITTTIQSKGTLESYQNGSLIIDSNIPCNVTYKYPTNIGQAIQGLNDAVNAMSDSLGGAWETLLILADKELQMSAIDPLTTENTTDIKNKFNEMIEIWG